MQVATHYGPATVSTVRHANGRGFMVTAALSFAKHEKWFRFRPAPSEAMAVAANLVALIDD